MMFIIVAIKRDALHLSTNSRYYIPRYMTTCTYPTQSSYTTYENMGVDSYSKLRKVLVLIQHEDLTVPLSNVRERRINYSTGMSSCPCRYL